MELVEKFIDTELVFCDSWHGRPEAIARSYIESVFYLHYIVINFDTYGSWRANINLDSTLSRMIRLYLPEKYRQEYLDILHGNTLYNDDHILQLCELMVRVEGLPHKLVYGCLLKVLFKNRPDLTIFKPMFLDDLMMVLTSSRLKRIICHPDSEMTNDQYNAERFFKRQLNIGIASGDYIGTLIRMVAVTDTIVLSFMKRVSKFKMIHRELKRASLNNILFTNTKEYILHENQPS